MTRDNGLPVADKTLNDRQRLQTNSYSVKQLPFLFDSLELKGLSAELHLEAKVQNRTRKAVLLFQSGAIAFCGPTKPTLDDFIAILKSKQKRDWFELMMESSLGLTIYQMSPRALLSRLVALHVFKQAEIRNILLSTVILRLEPFMAPMGEFRVVPVPDKGDYIPFKWSTIKSALRKRETFWQKLNPIFPNGMDSVPCVTQRGITDLETPSDPSADDFELRQNIQSWIDSTSDLVEISEQAKIDPLKVARHLAPAFQRGWLVNAANIKPVSNQLQSSILIVDANNLMRKYMGHLLSDQYQVYQATTAMEALVFLNQNSPDLMILDLALPGISGLELCRNIRKIPLYKDFPILVVTSQDRLMDKVKGRIAGVTEYIIKPFERADFLNLIHRYVQKSLGVITDV